MCHCFTKIYIGNLYFWCKILSKFLLANHSALCHWSKYSGHPMAPRFTFAIGPCGPMVLGSLGLITPGPHGAGGPILPGMGLNILGFHLLGSLCLWDGLLLNPGFIFSLRSFTLFGILGPFAFFPNSLVLFLQGYK